MRNRILFIFKCFFTLFIFIWLITNDHLDLKILFQKKIDLLSLFLAFLLLVIFFGTQFIRWWLLLLSQNIQITLFTSIKYSLISQFFTTILPGSISGDIIRTYYIIKENKGLKTAATSTVFIDRAIGLLTMILLGAIAYIFLINTFSKNLLLIYIGNILILTIAASAIILFFIIFFSKKTNHNKNFISKTIINTISNYKKHPKYILLSIIISLIGNIFYISAFWIILINFTPIAKWLNIAFFIPFILVSNLIPLTPGGIGIGETTSSFLFNMINVKSGAEVMLIIRLISIFLRLPGGFFFVFHKK